MDELTAKWYVILSLEYSIIFTSAVIQQTVKGIHMFNKNLDFCTFASLHLRCYTSFWVSLVSNQTQAKLCRHALVKFVEGIQVMLEWKSFRIVTHSTFLTWLQSALCLYCSHRAATFSYLIHFSELGDENLFDMFPIKVNNSLNPTVSTNIKEWASSLI